MTMKNIAATRKWGDCLFLASSRTCKGTIITFLSFEGGNLLSRCNIRKVVKIQIERQKQSQ